MAASVTKSQIIDSIKKILAPVSDRLREEGAIGDAAYKDTELVDLCRILVADVESMFRYTIDGETWSHVDDLTSKNPFRGFFSLDTIASEEVASFVYERAEKYFNQSCIRTREMDWFYLDFVIAVGFRVLLKRYDDNDLKAAYPMISKAIDESEGGSMITSLFRGTLFRYFLIATVKNLVLFGLTFFLFLLASDGVIWAGLLGGSLIVWKLYGWNSQWRLFFKLKGISAEKLSQFNAFYRLFSDGFVRWELLEHDIKRLRDLSIEFPLVLDTAITATKCTKVVLR
jgi:hypothetical protein